MILSFLLSSVGIVFVHRILTASLREIGISNLIMRLFAGISAFMILVFIFWNSHPAHLWLVFGTVFILLKLLPYFFSCYQEKLIQSHMLRALDQLILDVQSGQSLRSSLVRLSSRESSLLRVSWDHLVHALHFEDSSVRLRSPSLRFLFEELRRIDRSQTKCADQLRSLRKNLKTLENFRRRSGQVSLQIRMQAAISALLYVGLLLFVITQFGFYAHRTLIMASGTLFFTGMVTVFVIGRRLRWTI